MGGIGLLAIFILQFSIFNSFALAVDTLRVASPDPILEKWRWTTFDRGSGLAGPVRDIFEDRDGNVWFATDNGAQRYDGLRWTTYTTKDGLAHNSVRTVIQTRDGAIWFGTYGGGISRFDGKTWTTYTTKDSLASDFVWWRGLLQSRDGAMWAGCIKPAFSTADTAGTQGGISRFDGKIWKTIEVPGGSPRPNIIATHEASDGSIWFTTWAQGVLRFDGTRWTRHTVADGLAGNGTLEIMESRDGSIWVACYQKAGISQFDGKRWRTYTERDGLPEGISFVSIWQTKDGTIWAGDNKGTLCRLYGERWKAYTREEVPQLQGILGGQAARDGTIWFYGWGEPRALRFDPKGPWTVYAHPDSLFGGFETADGSVWFATRRAAMRLKDGLWTTYTPADGFLDGGATGLQQTASGALWFSGIH